MVSSSQEHTSEMRQEGEALDQKQSIGSLPNPQDDMQSNTDSNLNKLNSPNQESGHTDVKQANNQIAQEILKLRNFEMEQLRE